MFEQLAFVNFKSTKAFTELCTPLNVAFLIVGQLVLLIFLDCERKPLEIHSTYLQWLAVHPVFSPCTNVSASLESLYHLQMDVFAYVALPKSLRNHLFIGTTDFDSWYQSTDLVFCIWDCIFYKSYHSNWWQDLGAQSAAFPILITLRPWLRLFSFFVLLTSWAILH
jgi:hypothetical protein